jgi:O-methyltransferase involved in polyketide biosynthesis
VTTKASPEQVLGGTIMLEIRYRTMARLAEESGYTLVDLPCGYTPRAIEFAKKGLAYYGLDLPAVIQEAAEKIPALIPPEQRKLVRFQAVDATNYASLEKALEDVDGPVCRRERPG